MKCVPNVCVFVLGGGWKVNIANFLKLMGGGEAIESIVGQISNQGRGKQGT